MRLIFLTTITVLLLSCSSQKAVNQADMRVIDLSNKRLERIPPKILKKREKVESLILSDNNFGSFPLSIIEFRNLKTLSLKNNNLSVIPKEISKLTELQTLDLRGTKVTSLPTTLKEMSNLKLVMMFEIDLLDIQKKQIKCIMPIGCEVMFSKEYREYPPYDCQESNQR